MPNSTINATINGLNSTGGTTAGIDIQVAGSTVATVSSTGISGVGSETATAFIPSSSTVPANGLYLPAANTPGISSNSTKVLSVIAGSSVALEGATPQTGVGITFPATQVASSNVNTLDDYEEGTWTPTVEGSTGAGTGTYTQQYASYTKIGRVVQIQGYVAWSAHTGTGTIRLANIPFTSAAFSTYGNGTGPLFLTNMTLSANNVANLVSVRGSDTKADLLQSPVAGGSSTEISMDTSAGFSFCLTYVV